MEKATDVRDLVESTLSSLMPLVVYQDGVIVYASELVYQLLHFDSQKTAIVGANVYQFVHPAERQEAMASAERILQGGQPVHNVPRAIVDGKGNTVRVLGSAMPVVWQEKPALAATFLVQAVVNPTETAVELPPPSSAEGQPEEDEPLRAPSIGSLSPRERQVAQLIAQGFSTHNIGAILRVKDNTVRSHVKAIYRKTGAHSKVDLTRIMLGR